MSWSDLRPFPARYIAAAVCCLELHLWNRSRSLPQMSDFHIGSVDQSARRVELADRSTQASTFISPSAFQEHASRDFQLFSSKKSRKSPYWGYFHITIDKYPLMRHFFTFTQTSKFCMKSLTG
jgi:hypothetical protein